MSRMDPIQKFELYTALSHRHQSDLEWVRQEVIPVVRERLEGELVPVVKLQTLIERCMGWQNSNKGYKGVDVYIANFLLNYLERNYRIAELNENTQMKIRDFITFNNLNADLTKSGT